MVGDVSKLLDGGSGSIDNTGVEAKVEHAEDGSEHGADKGSGDSNHPVRLVTSHCLDQ